MAARRQWSATDARNALRTVPILADIDDEQLDRLSSSVERQQIRAHEWLFRLGDPSDAIYVIDSGRFAAVGADGQLIRDMARGDSIGELGLIAGEPRSAGVRALRDGVVWKIAAETFTAVLETTPQLQTAMLRVMARMLRESRSVSVPRGRRVVGILSTGDALAAPIVDAIASRLAPHGKAAVLAPSVETTSAVADYADLVDAFSESLDGAERANDWVLVVAEKGSGDLWRQYVVAQSDRLVVLVDRRHPRETLARPATEVPVHLITMTEPDPSWWICCSRCRITAPTTVASPPARRIAGRSLGLVLAGGGARGLAHFGVYEELTRAGVVIDRFGGTSAGAIAAAIFALGLDAPEATAAARKYMAHTSPLGDYTLPAVALTRGGRVGRLVSDFFGNVLIEHLPKGFFAVATDMITGEQIIHRRGPLALAVRSSISIPGLIPPVQFGERLLIDGGLLNNLPADVMCEDLDGEVICVDLRNKFVPSTDFGPLPSIFQPPAFIRRLLTGTAAALPPLQETLLRTVELASSKVDLRLLPRIAGIVEPEISAIGPLDFKMIDAALEAGRIAARAVLEAQPHLAS